VTTPHHPREADLLHPTQKMFKSAVVAAVLVQASATKIESFDHNNKAINVQMVEAINVSAVANFNQKLTSNLMCTCFDMFAE
jgi:hypothetical protein